LGAQLKNVAPQKQNAIFKPRAQSAKRNCAFKQLMLRTQVFQKIFVAQRTQAQLFVIKKILRIISNY
jgi:hypothetical protein